MIKAWRCVEADVTEASSSQNNRPIELRQFRVAAYCRVGKE